MRKWGFALCLVLSACSKPKDAEGTNPAVSESATASSGKRFYRAPAPASSIDMVANEGGWSLHATAATGCSDQKCIGEKCGPLCSQYVEERFKPFATAGQKNRLYFACFGGCLAGFPDGGVADAGH